MDSLHFVEKFIKDAWRKKEVVSALFLDVNSGFPSMVLSQLIHDMRWRGVPIQYTDWIRHKVEGRRTTHKFNGYNSELLNLPRDLDQGCQLSGITFQFYNTDLVDACDPSNGEEAVALMDNVLMLAHGKLLMEANTKLKQMMEKKGG